MNEKMKFPKNVCDALDFAKSTLKISEITARTHMKAWTNKNVLILNLQDADSIMRALVLGYEPELTAENITQEVYHLHPDGMFQKGMRYALKIHGIKYDWLEGDAE